MRTFRLLTPVLTALCIITACSKKVEQNPDETPPETKPQPVIDSSQCLLSAVDYGYVQGMPVMMDPITMEYDSLKRLTAQSSRSLYSKFSYDTRKITQTMWLNYISDSTTHARYVYTFDNNGRLLYNTYTMFYMSNTNDNWLIDSTGYEYDANGYLTTLNTYNVYQKYGAPNTKIKQERKFFYQGGNMVRRENVYYDVLGDPYNSIRLGADTITCTYDTTAWFPEAQYLYYIRDVFAFTAGKPNKNNVTGMELKLYDISHVAADMYKTIQYSYAENGKRLAKVTMTGITVKGATVNTSIGFSYKCN
jgi:hypothetical protein